MSQPLLALYNKYMSILDLIIEENKREPEPEPENNGLQDEIVGTRCPHCGIGRMVERASKFGLFLGCDDFPNCAYTINEKYSNNIGTAGYRINRKI